MGSYFCFTLICSGQDWPTYNQSVNGWRYNTSENSLSVENISELSLKWQFPPKDSKRKVGMVCATPSVVNGFVYFGTATFPAFYKLKPNGDLAWKFQLGSKDEKIRFQEMESQGLSSERRGVQLGLSHQGCSLFWKCQRAPLIAWTVKLEKKGGG